MKARRLSNTDVAKLRELERMLSRVIKKKERLKNIPDAQSRIEKGTEIENILCKSMIWLEKGHMQRFGKEIEKLEDIGIKFKLVM